MKESPIFVRAFEMLMWLLPATTIYNVMEVLGQLSFNLSAEQLEDWQNWLVRAYNLTVIWDVNSKETIAPESWREMIYERPFQKMQSVRMAFMDALILSAAEHVPNVKYFVTWNAKYFKGKTDLTVLTPEEYLAL